MNASLHAPAKNHDHVPNFVLIAGNDVLSFCFKSQIRSTHESVNLKKRPKHVYLVAAHFLEIIFLLRVLNR